MGSRRTGNGEENVYAAAQVWAERCLLADDSLFTPGKAIWTTYWLEELRSRFLDRPDFTNRDFYVKLEEQLADSPSEVHQLMGEVLFVYFLIVHQSGTRSDTKLQRISRVLGRSPYPVSVPADLATGLSPGIARPGQYFLSPGRAEQLGFVIEFAEQFKGLSVDEQEELISAPWVFKDFAEGLGYRSETMNEGANKCRAQRYAIYHLLFPDTFEGIVSADHKAQIAEAFDDFVNEPTDDVDRKLLQIRRGLETSKFEIAYGESLNFYDPKIRRQWDDGTPIDPDQDDEPELGVGFTDLASHLYLPSDFLEEINALLEDKKQVIFQGPPGTGKTYVAQALAEHIAGSKDRVTLVQFHPSYAYEDFVQGYRPTLENGNAGFKLQPGPLLQAAKQAQAEPDASHFLIIDEINRGNLAKVFGELYFLLEYRDREINLQYTYEPFRLPPSLYIIGTMNTADRSIALVDLALRRRFYFVEFHPDKDDNPIKGLLRRYLSDQAPGMEWVADVVDRANELLRDDPNAAIGPSYFMKPGLDEAAVRRIWKYGVLPYIEERLFGQGDARLAEFDLAKLRNAVSPDTGDVAPETNADPENDA